MKDIHKKLYAILMGDVSETITFMEDLILHEKYSKEDMMEAILMLRAALENSGLASDVQAARPTPIRRARPRRTLQKVVSH